MDSLRGRGEAMSGEGLDGLFASLAEGRETVAVCRLKEWAAERELSAGCLREAYFVADRGRRSARLTREEFGVLVREAEAIAREGQPSAALATTVVGAVAGAMVGGPLGAVAFASLGGAYVASAPQRSVLSRRSLLAGAAVGGAVAGPFGVVAGGYAASRAAKSYLGDPADWCDFEARATGGEDERQTGLGDLLTEVVRRRDDLDILSDQDDGGDFERRRGEHGASASNRASAAGVAVCASGGGLRAATAFLGLLAEAEESGFLGEVSHLVAVSGSCWSMAALYEDGDDVTAPLDVRGFLPTFRERLRRDLRAPRRSWYSTSSSSSSSKDAFGAPPPKGRRDDDWVFDRFAARRQQGHAVSASDVWGAHLATTLLDPAKRCGGYGISALGFRAGAPVPVATAVEARPNGPRWSREARRCERCGRAFGYVFGASRHHCRACGRSVCDSCCRASSSSSSSKEKDKEKNDVDPKSERKEAESSFSDLDDDDESDGNDDDDDDDDAVHDDLPRRRQLRRCRACAVAGAAAPAERTSWSWWMLTPQVIAPLDATEATPATHFGRRPRKEEEEEERGFSQTRSVSTTGGEPVGQLLGVVGSAFCASIELLEGALSWSDQVAKMMRTVADPAHGSPEAPLLTPASFSFGDPLGDDGVAFLGDAGFSCNVPLPVGIRLSDVCLCADWSAYPADDTQRVAAVGAECRRATAALATVGVHKDDVHFDVDAYASRPVSYHTVGDVLVVVITLAAAVDKNTAAKKKDKTTADEEKTFFDPLANAATGGFCASATASYDPADFDRLVTFVRDRLKRYLPEIRQNIHQHRRRRPRRTDDAGAPDSRE